MKRALRRIPSDWQAGNPTKPLLDLPVDPASDEHWFARHALSLASSGAMFHGRFVEVHVARLLGAHLPMTGTNEWDLLVPDSPPIRVEVKASTGPRATFRLAPSGSESSRTKRRRPDVWVLVHAPDRDSRDFTYFVAPDALVRRLTGSIGLGRVANEFERADRSTLLAEVRNAAQSKRA